MCGTLGPKCVEDKMGCLTYWDMYACKCFENFSAWRLPRKRPEAFMQIGSYGLKLCVSFFSLWNFQGLSLPGVLLECFVLDAIWLAQVWYRDFGKPLLLTRKEVKKQIWPPIWRVFTKAPQKKLVANFWSLAYEGVGWPGSWVSSLPGSFFTSRMLDLLGCIEVVDGKSQREPKYSA